MDDNFTYEFLPRRGIEKATHEFFNVKTAVNVDGQPIHVIYEEDNGALQFRRLDKKDFWSKGPMSEAGGWPLNKFTAGASKAITITEGKDDAMSVWQMMGKYPVYSVKSASSAVSDVRKDFKYLNSFDKIYLALDDDEPGQKATQQVAAIFGYGKVYHVKMAPYKDPHEFLEGGKVQEFKNAWFNASRFQVEGIKSSWDDIKTILDEATAEPGHPWPFPTLNNMTGGLKRGKSVLVSGLEGIGKTEFLHATISDIARTDPDANIGILHFEESLDETVKKQAGYYLKKVAHTDDSSVSKEDVFEAYKKLSGRPDRIHIVEHSAAESSDVLLAKIRFLVAACGCKYIFFDNITIIVTNQEKDSATAELDYLSTRLAKLVNELQFCLIFISHENDNEQTRGSRNISKICSVWINMKRDVKHENEYLRRILYLQLNKNRQKWLTGPAGKLLYDPDTGTLSELTGELPV